jgi:hypothetical protein
VERNVIAANRGDGVEISAVRADLLIGTRDNIVAGNLITDNAGNGVHVLDGAAANRIGTDGTAVNTVEGNWITGNLKDGVRVVGEGTVKNSIRGNSIHSNTLLGIDLAGDGVTLNDWQDPDTGANELQNYPVLTSATVLAGGTRVRGRLRSLPSTSFIVDFYANVASDTSGHGEGQRWLGSTVVTTGPGGFAFINILLGEPTIPGEFITATATEELTGNTSEFSAAIMIRTDWDFRSPTPGVPMEVLFDAGRPRIAPSTLEMLRTMEPSDGSSVSREETALATNARSCGGARELAARDAVFATELGATLKGALVNWKPMHLLDELAGAPEAAVAQWAEAPRRHVHPLRV